nr:hypothetical protein B0A51_08539 [Rachicladosporium sp. CCFEE 5018]
MPSVDSSDTPPAGPVKRTVHNWRQLETPMVQHDFDGEPDILNLTFDRRLELRKVLEVLFADVRKSTGRAVQVQADVKIRLAGPAEEHVYNVNLTDKAFDAAAFDKELAQSTSNQKRKAGPASAAESSPGPHQQTQQTPIARAGHLPPALGEQAGAASSSVSAPNDALSVVEIRSALGSQVNGQSPKLAANGSHARPPINGQTVTSALGTTPLAQATSTDGVAPSLKVFVNPSLGKLAPPAESDEQRAAKRARTDGPVTIDLRNEDDPHQALHQAVALLKRQGSDGDLEKLTRFIKDWHNQWTQQGSWLFDNINRLVNAPAQSGGPTPGSIATNLRKIERRIDHVQGVIGQSINTANFFVMAELANANRLLPWLEDCRKTGANKVQERDDAWRSKTAAFHDGARYARAAAEKMIEERLEQQQRMIEKQQGLLARFLQANDIDLDAEDKASEGTDEREESLGAQLTRELDEQEIRGREDARAKSGAEPIAVDDDG